MTTRPDVVRRVVGRRLAWYRSDADGDFWNRNWRSGLTHEFYARYRQGDLGEFASIFPQFLSKRGRILEAGCGLGQYVVALRARGYAAEGVDMAAETVTAVRALVPDVPISCQDVTSLSVPDGTYSGYISLGVVEHRLEGPEPFLTEAYRVLEKGGIGIFTVPHFHSLRRMKAAWGRYAGAPPLAPFYQFAFTADEFTALVREVGFEPIYSRRLNALKGIRDEWHGFRQWYDSRKSSGLRWGIQWVMERIPLLQRYLGHMLLVVVRKP